MCIHFYHIRQCYFLKSTCPVRRLGCCLSVLVMCWFIVLVFVMSCVAIHGHWSIAKVTENWREKKQNMLISGCFHSLLLKVGSLGYRVGGGLHPGLQKKTKMSKSEYGEEDSKYWHHSWMKTTKNQVTKKLDKRQPGLQLCVPEEFWWESCSNSKKAIWFLVWLYLTSWHCTKFTTSQEGKQCERGNDVALCWEWFRCQWAAVNDLKPFFVLITSFNNEI